MTWSLGITSIKLSGASTSSAAVAIAGAVFRAQGSSKSVVSVTPIGQLVTHDIGMCRTSGDQRYCKMSAVLYTQNRKLEHCARICQRQELLGVAGFDDG